MTVYVPQEPTRYVNGEQEPIFDLTPASEYGDINVLLASGQVMLNTAPMIQKLRVEMRDYNDEDYILAIGDPSALAAVVAVAAMYNNGKFKLLKWDRKMRKYLPININVNTGGYDDAK
jgi:hypothetical protein